MGKEDQTIMVIERKHLFGQNNQDYFQGFRSADRVNYESRILANHLWMRRGRSDSNLTEDAESNPDFKQPIAYVIVYNPDLKKVFAYQRSQENAAYQEARLRGNWSWGFGGHIEKADVNLIGKNPIQDSMIRELAEEIETADVSKPKIIGYINDDTPHIEPGKIAVGQVHFGILYLVEAKTTQIDPKDQEITLIESKFLADLENICALPNTKVDSWSKIALEPLRTILI
jgi:predicted NUDIX family phosphoesterase